MASIVVVASLGLGVLTGCQVGDSDKAAIIGDTSITEDRVTEIYENATAAAVTASPSPEASPEASPEPSPTPAAERRVTRQKIVNLLVSLELGRRIKQEKKLPEAQQPLEPEVVAQELGLAAQSEYVQLWAEWYNLQTVIAENTPRVGLTDAGLTLVYEALVKVQAVPAGWSVAEMKQQFAGATFAEAAILVSTTLGAEAEKLDVTINPKYQPISAPMAVSAQQSVAFYEIPYLGSDMVTDVSL
ncbi:hypothetical protein WEI85_11255 [Actinomycetes bacterium KLBMP 9797]